MNDRQLANFLNKFHIAGENDCWLWSAGVSLFGYGRFRINYKTQYAHRLSWLLYKGNIPTGLCVLHRCDTPACLNPKHLFLGTKKDNVEDMIQKGRWNGGGKYKKYCYRGHSLDSSYIINLKDGSSRRACKRCAIMRQTKLKNKDPERFNRLRRERRKKQRVTANQYLAL